MFRGGPRRTQKPGKEFTPVNSHKARQTQTDASGTQRSRSVNNHDTDQGCPGPKGPSQPTNSHKPVRHKENGAALSISQKREPLTKKRLSKTNEGEIHEKQPTTIRSPVHRKMRMRNKPRHSLHPTTRSILELFQMLLHLSTSRPKNTNPIPKTVHKDKTVSE